MTTPTTQNKIGFEKHPLLKERVPTEIPMGYIPARGFDYFSTAQLFGYAESGGLIDQINAIEVHRRLREAGGVAWDGEDELTSEHDFVIQHERHWCGGIRLVKISVFNHAKKSVKDAAEEIIDDLNSYPILDDMVMGAVELEAIAYGHKEGWLDGRLGELYDLANERDLTEDEFEERNELENDAMVSVGESTYPKEVFGSSYESVDIEAVII